MPRNPVKHPDIARKNTYPTRWALKSAKFLAIARPARGQMNRRGVDATGCT
jgi:hypothetical protein